MPQEEWLELESDPGLFTLLLEDFGVKGVQVEEIYDLSKPIDDVVYGFIFLFRWQQNADKKTPRRSARTSAGAPNAPSEATDLQRSGLSKTQSAPTAINTTMSTDRHSQIPTSTTLHDATTTTANISSKSHTAEDDEANIFFAHQIVPNSCATHSLLCILMNRPQVSLGPLLREFRRATMPLSSHLKGLAIGCMPPLMTAHNRHARKPESTDPCAVGQETVEHEMVEISEAAAVEYAQAAARAAMAAASVSTTPTAGPSTSTLCATANTATAATIPTENGLSFACGSGGGSNCGISVNCHDSVGAPPALSTSLTSSPGSSSFSTVNAVDSATAADTFHFVCFLPIGRYLYELDGLKTAPINHGPLKDPHSHRGWTNQCTEILRQRMKEQEVRYNLMAVVPDRRIALNDRIGSLRKNRLIVTRSIRQRAEVTATLAARQPPLDFKQEALETSTLNDDILKGEEVKNEQHGDDRAEALEHKTTPPAPSHPPNSLALKPLAVRRLLSDNGMTQALELQDVTESDSDATARPVTRASTRASRQRSREPAPPANDLVGNGCKAAALESALLDSSESKRRRRSDLVPIAQNPSSPVFIDLCDLPRQNSQPLPLTHSSSCVWREPQAVSSNTTGNGQADHTMIETFQHFLSDDPSLMITMKKETSDKQTSLLLPVSADSEQPSKSSSSMKPDTSSPPSAAVKSGRLRQHRLKSNGEGLKIEQSEGFCGDTAWSLIDGLSPASTATSISITEAELNHEGGSNLRPPSARGTPHASKYPTRSSTRRDTMASHSLANARVSQASLVPASLQSTSAAEGQEPDGAALHEEEESVTNHVLAGGVGATLFEQTGTVEDSVRENGTGLSHSRDRLSLEALLQLLSQINEREEACKVAVLEEERKRYSYRVDHARRVHNYDRFIRAFLTELANQDMLQRLVWSATRQMQRQRPRKSRPSRPAPAGHSRTGVGAIQGSCGSGGGGGGCSTRQLRKRSSTMVQSLESPGGEKVNDSEGCQTRRKTGGGGTGRPSESPSRSLRTSNRTQVPPQPTGATPQSWSSHSRSPSVSASSSTSLSTGSSASTGSSFFKKGKQRSSSGGTASGSGVSLLTRTLRYTQKKTTRLGFVQRAHGGPYVSRSRKAISLVSRSCGLPIRRSR